MKHFCVKPRDENVYVKGFGARPASTGGHINAAQLSRQFVHSAAAAEQLVLLLIMMMTTMVVMRMMRRGGEEEEEEGANDANDC